MQSGARPSSHPVCPACPRAMLTVNSESCFYLYFQGRRPGYFSFLDPFSPGVWLFMLLAYLAVSCVLFLVARYSLPFPVLTPPPRVHLWELHQRGWGAGVGRVEKTLVRKKPEGWARHSGHEPLSPTVDLAPPIRPSMCTSHKRHNATGQLVRFCFCTPASHPSSSAVSSPLLV